MYSDYVKHRAILHYKFIEQSLRKVSAIYKIGKSTLARWLKQDGIQITRKKRMKIVQEDLSKFVEQSLTKNSFLTCTELSKLIKKELNKDVSKSSVWKFIKTNNMSYKRTKVYVSKQNTQIQINSFIEQYHNDVVSIDETFFYLYDYPKYGYSKKGTPLRRPYKDNPKKRKITLYMAISKENIIGYKISYTHGNSKDYIEFIKSLNLQNRTLLMDNVAFHKTKLFKELIINTNNKVLYTPPYSPDYNPIELAFSKIKNTYRKLNFVENNTIEENIHLSIQNITSNDCKGFFTHVDTIIKKNLILTGKNI